MNQFEFHTTEEMLALCHKHKLSIGEVAKRYESERSGKSVSAVRNKMKQTRDVMYEAVRKGIHSTQKSKMGMVGGDAHKMHLALKKMPEMMGNKVTVRAMSYAMAVGEQNASMGRIVAFPTAGGAGVIPGVLFSSAEHFKAGKRKLLNGMFCSSAVGLIIAEGATLSAAKGGCQAEVGAGVAMAAAGLTEMRGGTPDQCFHASAMALKSYLGLACDPLGGLVEVPCIKRNSLGCMVAIGASDMAIAGVKSFIPFDEVVLAMRNIAKIMSPKIRETALGGLAVTKTGNMIKQKLGMKITPMDL
ncbi:MAG: L-serine ammonia-lyase, iron-sulfur-dependent, subunit alpha [Candidatus Peregrinibacteria bacterium]|nr:L-serine ammonia-lyase, iron-sulfur-dependent, subunit alpha [Candidatus Peregrinibacteria bacterium]